MRPLNLPTLVTFLLFLTTILTLPTDLIAPTTSAALPSITLPTGTTITTSTNQGVYCGDLTIIEGGFIVPMYTSPYCTNADGFEHFSLVTNVACGLCVIWDARDCQGTMRWWGGPDKQSKDVKGSQSYWCL